jgi:hypothetical protein
VASSNRNTIYVIFLEIVRELNPDLEFEHHLQLEHVQLDATTTKPEAEENFQEEVIYSYF